MRLGKGILHVVLEGMERLSGWVVGSGRRVRGKEGLGKGGRGSFFVFRLGRGKAAGSAWGLSLED
jgi:hypothetical protein